MRPVPLDVLGVLFCAALVAAMASGVLLGRAGGAPGSEVGSASAAGLTDTGFEAPTGLICRASWYSSGDTTASGESYEPEQLTAASRTLPLGSRILVTELTSGRSVIVDVNDRGPYVDGRCLDLSRAAFSLIAPLGEGVIPVRVEILKLL